MRLDGAGRVVTEGRRRMCLLADELTRAEVARRIHTTANMVTKIVGGARLPSLKLAIVIQQRLGIQCHEWEVK